MGQKEVYDWLVEHRQGTAYDMAKDLDTSVGQIFKCIGELEKWKTVKLRRDRNEDGRMVYVLVSYEEFR